MSEVMIFFSAQKKCAGIFGLGNLGVRCFCFGDFKKLGKILCQRMLRTDQCRVFQVVKGINGGKNGV